MNNETGVQGGGGSLFLPNIFISYSAIFMCHSIDFKLLLWGRSLNTCKEGVEDVLIQGCHYYFKKK